MDLVERIEKLMILIEIKYLDYAADTMYGRELCTLPESIKDAIEEFFNGCNLANETWAHPDNVYVNSFTELDKSEAIEFAYGHSVDDEEVEEYDDETLIDKLNESCTFLGKVDDSYFILQ